MGGVIVSKFKVFRYFASIFVLALILDQIRPVSDSIFRARPDFFFAATVACAYCYGPEIGVIMGLLFAYVRDADCGRILGPAGILFLFYGIFASMFFPKRFPDNRFLPFLQAFLLRLAGAFIVPVILYFLPGQAGSRHADLLPLLVISFEDFVRLLPYDLIAFGICFFVIRFALPLTDKEKRTVRDPFKVLER